METITIPKEEHSTLRNKAELAETLLTKLVRGLEDVEAGRISEWKKVSHC